MALNHSSSFLRDKSRRFPRAEGFNPQGCTYFLDDHQAIPEDHPRGQKIPTYEVGFVRWRWQA
jgi:hypothetical protein